MSARRITLLLLAVALVLPAAADAATKHGITPTSPKAGSTIPAAQSPTIKGRVKGPGKVFVHVCTNKKKDATGVICDDAAIQQAKKKKNRFSAKLKFFDFDGSWLNNPGTYYWQAVRIACVVGSDLSDCNQEGPIVKFKVG